MDGSEVAVLSIAVSARTLVFGGAVGISYGNIALGAAIITLVGLLLIAAVASQPMQPNASSNANSSGRRTRRVPRRPMKDDCYQKYLAEQMWCVLQYSHNDSLLQMCDRNAWANYIRCKSGLSPKPFIPAK